MRTALVLLSFAMALPAQDAAVKDLVSHDWRTRNRAAAVLADRAEIDVVALLDVLRTPWHGPMISVPRLGGGYGGQRTGDPLDATIADARQELVKFQPSPIPWDAAGFRLPRREHLVVPWHPHELACWLLCRDDLRDDVANRVRSAPRPSLLEAQLWWHLAAPDAATIRDALADAANGRYAAVALWLDPERGRAELGKVLADGDAQACRAVLMLGKVELATETAQMASLLRQFLHDPDREHRKHAGHLIDESGARATPLLLAALADRAGPERALLGMLCVLGPHNGEVGDQILPHVAAGPAILRDRALAVLATAPIAANTRAAAARAAWAVLSGRATAATRLLALDALGNLGDGVDASMRAQLESWLDEPAFPGSKARVLACLRRLGAVPAAMPTATKVYLTTTVHTTVDTWLAVADDGEAAAEALTALVRGGGSVTQARMRSAVIRRLAHTAPQLLRRWLSDEAAHARSAAIHGLRSLGDRSGVAAADIEARLADDDPWVARAALSWLTKRPDAKQCAFAAMALVCRTSSDYLIGEAEPFLRAAQLPFDVVLGGLAPMLCRGVGWELVRGGDRMLLRKACTEWLAKATDDAARHGLLGELVRLGIEGDAELELVRRALAEGAEPVMTGLAHAPKVPEALRTDLERLVDSALANPAPSGDWLAYTACGVLCSHFAR